MRPAAVDAFVTVARGEWPLDDDSSSLRPEVVRLVREQVRAGRYRPPAGDVAEQLAAWLFLAAPPARAGQPAN